jgi:D-alanyl-D-alanine dipeptidase
MKPIGLKSAKGIFSIHKNASGARLPVDDAHAWLYSKAYDALQAANMQILDQGGRLYIMDMWRNPQEQYTRWLAHQLGLKSTYSSPPGRSLHECGLAIDVDIAETRTIIPSEQLVKILAAYDWVRRVAASPWHFEYLAKVSSGNRVDHTRKCFELTKIPQQLRSDIDYKVEDANG